MYVDIALKLGFGGVTPAGRASLMQRVGGFLTLAAFLLSPSYAAAGFLGAYIWGGLLTKEHITGPESFYDTVSYALENGFDTVRFMLGPNDVADYNLPASTCSTDKQLACFARLMFASPAWDNAALRRVIITSQDFVCSSTLYNPYAEGCLDDSVLTAHAAAIQADYLGLLHAIKDRFGSRKVQFVLTNWEGDNMVYCGAVFTFSLDASFATKCRARWPTGQTNAQRAQALLHWFLIKDRAISAFMAENPAFNVIHVPEFAAYNLFDRGCNGSCTPTDLVWHQIRLSGGRPYCSYSSYDSEGPPDGTYLLHVIDIHARACDYLMIGEAGFDMFVQPVEADIDLFEALYQINGLSYVLGVVPWNFVNGPNPAINFGLFNTDGAPNIINYMGPLRPTRLLTPHQ